MRSRTASLAGLASLLALGAMTGCSGDEDDDAAGSSGLADAQAVLPATTTQVTFADRAAAAERAGVGGLDVPVDEYVEAVREGDVPITPLGPLLAVADEAGVALDDRGVVWTVDGTVEGGAVTVLKVDDEIDLDAVAAELEGAGLTATEDGGRVRLTTDRPSEVADPLTGAIAGGYPIIFFDVVVDADAGLLVTGSGLDDVLGVIDGEAPALEDGPLADVLADAAGAATVLATLAPRCNAFLGSRVTPEQLERIEAEAPDFGQPVVSALVQGPDGAQARLVMADEATAEADVPVRQTYLDEGAFAGTGQPVSDVVEGSVSQDGSTVVVDLELTDDRDPTLLQRMATGFDGPFACY